MLVQQASLFVHLAQVVVHVSRSLAHTAGASSPPDPLGTQLCRSTTISIRHPKPPSLYALSCFPAILMIASFGDTLRKLSVGRQPLRLHRELAYGKVGLLLTGTPLAEGCAPDLHHRLIGAGALKSISCPRRGPTYSPASVAKSTIANDAAGTLSLRHHLLT
jgi:hypothetical protein